MHPDAHRAEGATIAIPPGAVMVRHSIFRGRDMGLTIYIHPADVTRAIPSAATTPGLTPHERLVLCMTVKYKSSYGGYDRYDMAKWDVPESVFPSRAEWHQARVQLIAYGLLDKRGAITAKGRNAL
jgi:hypothetical protein